MKTTSPRLDPDLNEFTGPFQGAGLLGDVTEAIHEWLNTGWPEGIAPPRISEELDFEPKDREQVVYVYMYRVTRNEAAMTTKRWRKSRVQVSEQDSLFERAPIVLDAFYMLAVHAKFRSDAERLLGWVLLRLNEATHLLYRPRKYVLPDGRELDSTGAPWRPDAEGEDVIMQKVSLALVDDLPIGEAVHFFNIHEAPFRPYLTYRARLVVSGRMTQAPPTVVRSASLDSTTKPPEPRPGSPAARARLPQTRRKAPFGPEGTPPEPIPDDTNEED